eukprot:6196095-Pleurochrysis_carterae.AAC.2
MHPSWVAARYTGYTEKLESLSVCKWCPRRCEDAWEADGAPRFGFACWHDALFVLQILNQSLV